MADQSSVVTGRVWKFGSHINTDLIFPNSAFRMAEAEQYKMVFKANRPGWVEQVQPGDLLIAGDDFGYGSGRPVGWLLRLCGIRGVVAESINGLCLRNCVNAGMPAMECKGVLDLFDEGDIGRFDYANGLIDNLTQNTSLKTKPMPPLFLEMVNAGSVLDMLIREGLIEAGPEYAANS